MRDTASVENRDALGYQAAMMKWFCTLILLLFTVTAGAALPMPSDDPVRLAATTETLVVADLGVEELSAPRHCCADEFKAKPAAVLCLVDFSILPAALALNTPQGRQDFAEERIRIAMVQRIEPLHRPPIV